jgi:2,3-bisphosphoglycerate-dependent phosphoglycerate mutase
VLVRHGQSEWNALGRFTGSVDIGLSAEGRSQAARCGLQLLEAGLVPGGVHTSTLRRAYLTADILLSAADWSDVQVHRTNLLNERSYGLLEGRVKAHVRREFGDQLFDIWRRSYSGTPPPAPDGRPGESLQDVTARVRKYWDSTLAPHVRNSRSVLVVGHGSSLRAMARILDGISEHDISGLNVPTGMPLVYELDEDLRPTTPGGRYLEPQAAVQAARDVANEGREEIS